MTMLFETLDSFRNAGYFTLETPDYVKENLNKRFELRPYQLKAFENFIGYFENTKLCKHPTQLLFQMATGSGKTLVMAGLMLYLYTKGYRNFLFFVHRKNIVNKTKANFLAKGTGKYLFADEINIDGEQIAIKEVENFQYADKNAINICFYTTAGLRQDMFFCKEGSMTLDDFASEKVVLIADEAHHLNADIRRMTNEEKEDYHSWEETVKKIFNSRQDNVLLEFTATAGINKSEAIRNEYEDKLIMDYDLSKFYEDGYSKEIHTLRSDIDIMDRAFQAIILSQYRLKLFQEHNISIKPVVLFKSQYVTSGKKNNYTSDDFRRDFLEKLSNLDGAEVSRIINLTVDNSNTAGDMFEYKDSDAMFSAKQYFARKNISFDQLAEEFKAEFSDEHCISANGKTVSDEILRSVNTLEDKDNPYRAVFECESLNEGWDVLNLFDIVRLYETRQSGGRTISKTTTAEAQLIGRGARYCPFQIDPAQQKYMRKYDNDLENDLRICEKLYYHCQSDSRYIAELHNALKQQGLDLKKTTVCEYKLKDSFKADELYKQGFVFINTRKEVDRSGIKGLAADIKDRVYCYSPNTNYARENNLLSDERETLDLSGNKNLTTRTFSIGEIAEDNYAFVNKAMMKFPALKFNMLKKYFPNLKSTREFITSSEYLASIKVQMRNVPEKIPAYMKHEAVCGVLSEIAKTLYNIEIQYEGTKEFYEHNIRDIFKDKTVLYTDIKPGGIGYPQNDILLANEDWFAYNDNYGTSEEKSFVSFFKGYLSDLQKKYSKVFLVRNERAFHLYSFEKGWRFEPDYVIFLKKDTETGFEQMQVFVEPKGEHLFENDIWKEEFLVELKEKESESVIQKKIEKIGETNKYRIWGFHFYNSKNSAKLAEFTKDFTELLN